MFQFWLKLYGMQSFFYCIFYEHYCRNLLVDSVLSLFFPTISIFLLFLAFSIDIICEFRVSIIHIFYHYKAVLLVFHNNTSFICIHCTDVKTMIHAFIFFFPDITYTFMHFQTPGRILFRYVYYTQYIELGFSLWSNVKISYFCL